MLLRACGRYERAPSFLRQYGGQVMGCLKASGSLMGAIVSGVTTAPANPASGGAASQGGGKSPPLNQQVHPPAVKPGR